MNHYKWIKQVTLVSLLMLLAFTAGCSLWEDAGESNLIDPPPEDIMASLELDGDQSFSEEGEIENVSMSLYFKDQNGFVVPVTMNVPLVEGIAKQKLRHMVNDGPIMEKLPYEFTPLLPSGTEILGLNIENQLAIVDFSEEFLTYDMNDERKVLEAVTWALTDFPTVDNVVINVNGETLTKMPAQYFPLDEPLSREMGINIEQSEGVPLSQTTPVTLYFLDQTNDSQSYFVPVTRLIQIPDDIVEATMKELIKGPYGPSGLHSVMIPSVEVLNTDLSEDLITLNLSDHILGLDEMVPEESLQSIILSLTENTDATKFQFLINNQSYDSPVTKSTQMNVFEM
ncbi:GerMN domain-containing protein [Chengkuizengella axinellae]|uniref:GerMN domain-containing protein n=1 Tax=Chengkuizengella axinellae TaxID=3064388 RepID=A0ABT9ITG7_9BACL|nr:GerMN domain-containing protein [Chengkuizengella sp. 2205SS18-9]MDP5272646.1 GerMN domain-containing protein [Chengkuizengella sp. 2205SS18-9]